MIGFKATPEHPEWGMTAPFPYDPIQTLRAYRLTDAIGAYINRRLGADHIISVAIADTAVPNAPHSGTAHIAFSKLINGLTAAFGAERIADTEYWGTPSPGIADPTDVCAARHRAFGAIS